MKEQSNFTYLGRYEDICIVKNTVSTFSDSDWVRFADRRKTMSVAGGNTDTIPLIYGTNDRMGDQSPHEYLPFFEHTLNDISHAFKATYGECRVVRSFMARMHPLAKIKRHKDVGSISARTHRIHLPIITNDECFFTVGDETIHMDEGDLWIIDNTDKYHSVTNGDQYRVHLITDVIELS